MGWKDLLTFAKDSASWIAPVAGAAAGALSGGRDQTTTQSSAPVLPENVKKGYDRLIDYTGQNFDRPFQARQTTRPDMGGNAFQRLFQNPELQKIQAQNDAEAASMAPQRLVQQYAQQAAAQNPQTKVQASQRGQSSFLPDMDPLELEMRRIEQGYRDADGPGNLYHTNNSKYVGGNGNMNLDVVMRDFKDGQVNKYTGETFDKGRYLQYLKASEDLAAAYPRSTFGVSSMPENIRKAFDEEQGVINRMTYQPSKSKQGFSGMISSFAPMIAGGLLAAPLGAAMAGLGGAAMPASHGVGMLANKLGSSLVSNLGSSLASGVKR